MTIKASFVAAAVGTLFLAAPAFAADNAMQVCGAKYQAAKTAKTLPAGQTWNQFLSSCRATLPKAAPAVAAAPAAKPAPTAMAAPAARPAMAPAKPVATAKPAAAPRAPGQLSPAQAAERTRIRACADQWHAAKAANKIPAGQTWPKYWSACSARMKG